MTAVNVQDFGAIGDGVHNDAPAFQAAIESATLQAIRTEFATTPEVCVPPVNAFYSCEETIKVLRGVRIRGAGGRNFSGSRLVFPPNVTGMNFYGPEGEAAPPAYQPMFSGIFSELDGIRLDCLDPLTTSGFGILSNTSVRIVNTFVGGFGSDGVFANANCAGTSATPDTIDAVTPGTYYGNADLMFLENVTSKNNKGNGFRFLGNCTNAGVLTLCDASGNKLCGYLDESMSGQLFNGCHAAANGTRIGHNGGFYTCIKVHTSSGTSEPGVGATWRLYWQSVAATVAQLSWTTATKYYRTGSFHSVVDLARNTYVGCYSEGGIQGKGVMSKNDIVMGGTLAMYGIIGPVDCVVIGDGMINNVRTRGQAADGVFKWASDIGSAEVPDIWRFGHNQDRPDSNYVEAYRMSWSGSRKQYEIVRTDNGKRVMAFPGNGWNRDGYTEILTPIFENGVLIGGPKTALVRASYGPPQAGLTVKKGELFINTNSAPGGFAMYQVITGGITGSTAVVKGCAAVEA